MKKTLIVLLSVMIITSIFVSCIIPFSEPISDPVEKEESDIVDEDSYTLMGYKWFSTLTSGTEIKNTSITDIIFGKEIPTGTIVVNGVDLTADTTGNVKGYIVANGINYKIYIVGDFIFANANCDGMFYGFSNLTGFDFGNLDTSNVTSMSNMFCQCSSLTSLDLSKFDTSSVTKMGSMFYNCTKLESLDLSKFDTSKVSDNNANRMFVNCAKLTSVKIETADDTIQNQLGDDWTYTNGVYTAQAPAAPLIVEFILKTCSNGFPYNTYSENTAPEGAWETETGKSCYLYSSYLVFNNQSQFVHEHSKSDVAKKSQGIYSCSYGDIKINFDLTGGTLTQIEVVGPEGGGTNYNGIYAMPSPKPE